MKQMKKSFRLCIIVCVIGLFAAVVFSNCSPARQYNLSLKNTLSIFLLNDKKDYYFCIPVQYMGDYQIARFEFDHGSILIDDYDILLKKNKINISVYLNEKADEDGSATGEFNLVYLEKKGRVLVSKMAEPLAKKNKPDYMNHYYIFIEKYLTNSEMKNIVNKYKEGNVNSKMSVWYDLTIDNEEQNGSGLSDDFELYDGLALDPAWFPPNLNFFKARYLQK
jgi:hypothetical protein